MKLNDPHGRIARWTAELNQFNYKIEYIPGKTNTVPDAMSRHTDADQIDSVNSEVVAAVHVGLYKPCTPQKALAKYGRMHEFELLAAIQTFTLPSDEEWAREQRQDPDWAPYIKYIESRELPQDDKLASEILHDIENYALKGEQKILCRVTKISPQDEVKTARRVVPSIWRKLICAEYHDSLWQGAHMGRDKTYEKIKEVYFFKNMNRYVDLWVASCTQCQAVKSPIPKSTSPLGVIEAKGPWDLVCIDLWGPIHRSSSGNKYVLTIIDGFTKWAMGIPIPNKKAATIAGALHSHFFTKFPNPRRIHSDLGKEFVNKVLATMYDFMGVKQSNTTAYHPQGNAYAERLHKFFRHSISSFVNDDQDNWDALIPTLMAVYNDTLHNALGVTPAEMVFGRRLGQPAHENLEAPEETNQPLSHREWAEKLKYILYKTQQLVFAKIEEKKSKNSIRSKNVPLTKFDIGQKVRLWTPQKSTDKTAKLIPAWSGPNTVESISQDGKVYYLKDKFGDTIKYPVSILRLAAYTDRDETLTEENIKLSKAKFKKQKEIQLAEMPLDSSDSDDTLAQEVDNGEDEYFPSQPTTQPEVTTKKKKDNAQEIIISQPDLEDYEVQNEPEVEVVARRPTRSSKKPLKLVSAQPETQQKELNAKKRKTRNIRLYH
jgi:transposase InsO family protein